MNTVTCGKGQETGRATAGRQVIKVDRRSSVDAGMELMPPPLGWREQSAGLTTQWSWAPMLAQSEVPGDLQYYPWRNLYLTSNGAQNPSAPEDKDSGSKLP